MSTDEGNGTLYYYVSENSNESAATIKASGVNKPVIASGIQNVYIANLTPETTYYLHYVQEDAADNESNAVSSGAFTTEVYTPSTNKVGLVKPLIRPLIRQIGN